MAGDGDALGVDGALVGIEVEDLLVGARPGRNVKQVAADLVSGGTLSQSSLNLEKLASFLE